MNEKIKLRLSEYKKEIKSLKSAIDISILKFETNEFEFFKDSVIQRFEYSVEWSWKLLKIILNENEWIECYSPKDCIRNSFKLWYIDNIEIWFKIIESRNMSSHVYNEDFTDILYEKIKTYFKYLENLIQIVDERIKW